MAISLIINGITYDYPEDRDPPGWGIEATDWATAVSAFTLQRTGGLFPLSADIDFGLTNGLIAPHFTSSSLPVAQTGVLRLAHTDNIAFRDHNDLTDVYLGISGNDILAFNSIELVDVSTPQVLTNKDINGASALEISYLIGTTSNIQTQLDALIAAPDAIWGSIAGTLTDQTDLQLALDTKADQLDLLSHTDSTNNPHSTTITNLLDTAINTPALLDVLTYTGTEWIASPPSGNGGTNDHLLLTNIGTNTHPQIDTHIADGTIHYLQSAIAITESQISDLQPYITDITNESLGDLLDVSSNAPTEDQVLAWNAVTSEWEPRTRNASGIIKEEVTQIAHGFVDGQALYIDASSVWQLAQANNVTTLATQICEVIDPDNFYIVQIADITTLSGLVPGDWYYCSTVTPGLIVNSPPGTGYSNPVGFAQSTTVLHVQFLRASEVFDLLPSGSTSHSALADLGADDHTQYALADGSRGDFEPTNPNIQSHISNMSNPHATDLNLLTDVTVTTPIDDNVLTYQSGSWVNVPRLTGIDWGVIGGTLSDQTDLQAALDLKSDTSHLHTGVYEPVITPNTAFNKNFGLTAGTVSEGDHTHPIVSVPIPIEEKTSSYTLIITDVDKLIEMNVVAPNTLTVPVDAVTNFPIGTQILIQQTGAGQTTVGGAGITFQAANGLLSLNAQFSMLSLIKKGLDLWTVAGDMV